MQSSLVNGDHFGRAGEAESSRCTRCCDCSRGRKKRKNKIVRIRDRNLNGATWAVAYPLRNPIDGPVANRRTGWARPSCHNFDFRGIDTLGRDGRHITGNVRLRGWACGAGRRIACLTTASVRIIGASRTPDRRVPSGFLRRFVDEVIGEQRMAEAADSEKERKEQDQNKGVLDKTRSTVAPPARAKEQSV
jgi:hypothetical protein